MSLRDGGPFAASKKSLVLSQGLGGATTTIFRTTHVQWIDRQNCNSPRNTRFMEFAHEQNRCSHRFGRDQRIYARGCGGVHLKQGYRRLSLALGNGISDLHSFSAPIFGPLRTPLTLTSSGGSASGAAL